MNIGDSAVSHLIDVVKQIVHAGDIVGYDGNFAVKRMVDRDDRQLAADQVHDIGIIEIHAGDAHAVKPAVSGMGQIGQGPLLRVTAVDECNIETGGFGGAAEAVQYGCKEIVSQAASCFIGEKNADIKGPVGFQRFGGGIRKISHVIGDLADPLTGFGADIIMTVQRLTDCCNGNAAGSGNIFQ